MYLSIIIPAYNEAKRITSTLFAVNAYLHTQSYDYEILVLNDGSKDNTAQVVRSLQKDIPHLTLIDNKENKGKGGVVHEGMLKAQGDIRLFMDADNSTTIEHVERALPYFPEGYDVVIGSRRIPGANIVIHQPWIRDVLGSIFRMLVRSIMPLGVKDSQAGFKVFSAKAAQDIFIRQTIGGWAFDVEVLSIAKQQGYKIKEIPITWKNDDKSTVRLSGMIKMLFEVFRVRLNIRKGIYK